MVRIHHNFEWDDAKEEVNVRKHDGITFDEAARVLEDLDGDRYHLDRLDTGRDEARYVTTASDPDDRATVYVIVWTDRSTDDEQITRIISARFATKKEKRAYVDEIGG